MEQVMCSKEIVIMPYETITVELRGRTWIIEFTEWQQMAGTSLGYCLCGFRIDGVKRTLVRVNADFIDRINNFNFKSIQKPTH